MQNDGANKRNENGNELEHHDAHTNQSQAEQEREQKQEEKIAAHSDSAQISLSHTVHDQTETGKQQTGAVVETQNQSQPRHVPFPRKTDNENRKKQTETHHDHSTSNPNTNANTLRHMQQTPASSASKTASSRPVVMRTNKSKLTGNQGSEAEYRRIISAHRQKMQYEPNEIVIFFVPRLAQKGRYKDRIGKIKNQLEGTNGGEALFEIIDQQNGSIHFVPWKWVCTSPNPHSNSHTYSHSASEQNKVIFVPMKSLSTNEEKMKEFDRRMRNQQQQQKRCTTDDSPPHQPCRDSRDVQRGRSVHHHDRTARNQLSSRKSKTHRVADSIDVSRYHQPQHLYQDSQSRKKHRIRSFSVFPQHRYPRFNAQTSEPSTFKSYPARDLYPPQEPRSFHVMDRKYPPLYKTESAEAAATDSNREREERECERGHYLDAYHRESAPYHHRERSSRSRWPSHIRPSNRIHRDSPNRHIINESPGTQIAWPMHRDPHSYSSPNSTSRYHAHNASSQDSPAINAYHTQDEQESPPPSAYHHRDAYYDRYYQRRSSRSRSRSRERSYYSDHYRPYERDRYDRYGSPYDPPIRSYDYYRPREHRGDYYEYKHAHHRLERQYEQKRMRDSYYDDNRDDRRKRSD